MAKPWSLRAASWVRRAALPVVILGGFLLYRSFGFLRVPAAMDTLVGTHPPASACLIEKWPSSVVVGSVVFVDLAEGGTLLARVAEVTGDGAVRVACDNPASRWAGLVQELGPLPLARVRGLVLVVFAPDVEAPPSGR